MLLYFAKLISGVVGLLFKKKLVTKILLIIIASILPVFSFYVLNYNNKTNAIVILLSLFFIVKTVFDRGYYLLDKNNLEISQYGKKTVLLISDIKYVDKIVSPGKLAQQNTNYYIITTRDKIGIKTSYLNSENNSIVDVLCKDFKISQKESLKLISRK